MPDVQPKPLLVGDQVKKASCTHGSCAHHIYKVDSVIAVSVLRSETLDPVDQSEGRIHFNLY